MDFLTMLIIILQLVGGLSLFLFGMDLMGDGLKKLAGGKLESILARLTSNKWMGLLLGFMVTAVIQSSSATTVMLVGFVNSGIMSLGQTISTIMGANIGTTVTSWLLSLKDIKGAEILNLLKPENFTPVLAAIGVIITMTTKSDSKRNIATILLGFSVLIFGMEAMSDSVSSFKDNKSFQSLLTMFSNNPVMGIIVGTIFTAIIQSSSASVGILQVIAGSDILLTHATALPVLLGMNIGTTITPIISAISGNTDAKRVAASCLYIKMIGVAVVAIAFYLLYYLGFKPIVAFMADNASFVSIAIAHTVFNIISTIILMPFCSLIERLAIKTFKIKENAEGTDDFAALDDRFLSIPTFAVEKCRELVCDMAKISKKSMIMATELLDSFNEDKFRQVMEMEATVDKYEDKTSTYLVKIAANNMSSKDSKAVTELLHCIGDIERISDHAVNIAEAAQEMHSKEITFSQHAQKDIKIITDAVLEVLDLAVNALVSEDLNIATNVEPLEQVIDRLKRKIKAGHITRLRQGDCTMELGFILSDLLTNYERVADHCSNIAVCLIEISHDSFETHEYLSSIKNHNNLTFDELYEHYKEKYALS